MTTKQNEGKGKKEKTVINLDIFIRMTILGLMCNPNYSDLGKIIKKTYEELFGKI